MSKNLPIIALTIALAMFGGATYAKDRASARVQDNIPRVIVDDTMLTMFVAPVGIVQSLVDEMTVYRTMH